MIQIERVRWDEDDAELEVRGVVSSPAVTLSVRFLGRAEPLSNEDGSFRGEFSAVEDNPEQVTVTASDGASASARVEVD